jgi:hypothetical protein
LRAVIGLLPSGGIPQAKFDVPARAILAGAVNTLQHDQHWVAAIAINHNAGAESDPNSRLVVPKVLVGFLFAGVFSTKPPDLSRALVSRFRSSFHRAATSFTNFGIEGH